MYTRKHEKFACFVANSLLFFLENKKKKKKFRNRFFVTLFVYAKHLKWKFKMQFSFSWVKNVWNKNPVNSIPVSGLFFFPVIFFFNVDDDYVRGMSCRHLALVATPPPPLPRRYECSIPDGALLLYHLSFSLAIMLRLWGQRLLFFIYLF